MGIGVWEPGKRRTVSCELLAVLLSTLHDVDMDRLKSTCDIDFIEANAWMMKLEEGAWRDY